MTNETNGSSFDNERAAEAGQGGSPVSASASTLPLRGLAMVLIAVAVMFGLWALYAFTQGQDGRNVAQSTSATSDNTVGEPAAVDSPQPANADAQPGNEAGNAATDAAGAENSEEANAENHASPAPGAPQPVVVNVLNNSMVPNLAADVSDRLRAEGHTLGEVGNFADEILPENTVFFPAGNAEAEALARKLADEFHGVAREATPALPEHTRGGVTVVLTQG
ncbi:MAG: LytR C-terminal domain-containing protein [Corynebacterium sp.]|nr:LytR C-terminal domain-containing protein [Corynebacterium sp.]